MKKNNSLLLERPEGIIITMSTQELKEKGFRNWLENITDCMAYEDCAYYWRVGNQPKLEGILYVYLCIAGRIRYRGTFVESLGPREMNFGDRTLFGKAWIMMTGPLVRAPHKIYRKGFQGFRYTQKLF